MILYIYSKCSTCQKAVRFLEKKKSIRTKEITVTPPSIAELKQMLKLQNGQLKKLFNTSGNLYKEMHLSQKLDSMSEDEALELLSKNGMLVKRPFLLGDGFGLVGFNEDRWAEAIN
jgi:arsenate reductase